MASKTRESARNTILVGLIFAVPAVALGLVAHFADLDLFAAFMVPLAVFGGAVIWLGTFDWFVSRGAEIVKATN